MAYLFFIVGILFVLNGFGATPRTGDGSVMHQLYSAAYIIGGFVLSGIGAVIEKMKARTKVATAQAETVKLMAMDLQAIRAAQAASDLAEDARHTAMNSHAEAANQWRERADSCLTNIENNTRRP